MKEYKNYLFDLYGTLVDIHTDEENDFLWQRMSILLGMEGVLSTPEMLKKKYMSGVANREAAARKCHGSGVEIDIAPVFASFYDGSSINAGEKEIAHLAQMFRIFSLEKLQLFSGVPTLLQTLKAKGKKVYLLSNAQALFTLPELRALELEQYFDGIIISSQEGLKKPDKGLYQLALDRYNLEPSETVMVGNDDCADCWGAFEAGLDSMYVFTEQSPKRTRPLPKNCRILNKITDII